MKTAVIVLTYNRPAALLAVLRALAPQCGAQDEVWIADDGSTPENVRQLKAGLPDFSCRVRHVWHPDTGFTAARSRNLAAVRSSAEYVVFLDGDCVPQPNWLRQHRALAEPGHFLNGSRVLLGPALTQRVERGEVKLSSLSALDWLRARMQGDCNKLTHLLPWPASLARHQAHFRWKGIRSCNFGLWRSDLVAVNGFDESFSGWGHEDADLVLRLHNLGLHRKNGFCATEVFHLWHQENARDQEQANRSRVLSRLQSGQVRAEAGLDAAIGQTDVLVSVLR
jgi:glycosyltransferase involved in cell wall biosynthesis